MSVREDENTPATAALRAELKKWENAFRDARGRKPARADIKADANIGKEEGHWQRVRVLIDVQAAKYKLFDRLAGRKAAAPPPPPAPAATPKKSTRHSEPIENAKSKLSATPRKTPSKTKHNTLKSTVLSPVQEVEPTPAFIRNALGPTPQKDGQVLGIFDIDSGPTPSKVENTATAGLDTVVAGTPSKAAAEPIDQRFSRTPQSVSKRYYLDAFAGTPLKRKRETEDVGTTSSSKRKYATPSFLRRSFPLALIDEEDAESTAASRPPFRKRGLVRSLSSIIQGLKKQEEERMDDEWDVMNEIEEEETRPQKKKVPKLLVGDSQATEMPLGPDRAPESDDEDSSAGNENQTRKPWKKKGLKRQTRRVIMRPVFHKAKKADDLEEDEEEEEQAVPETQPQDAPTRQADDAEDSELDADELAAEHEALSKDKLTKKKKQSKKDLKKKDDKNDTAKTKTRKVNPEAHANFRKLKIKNKNSKANGRGRKFGRR
ncbi:Hypothetical predicted protein [Lecanosticta acicola]|uniref:DNA replication regulator SLD2 n=1 Tax=Lecanosticta acicola TaxID=111012 RepID=A0AAI8YV33_9PEZI|nr:Hypothetical predicted protein [Lecanosticta acicola]